MRSANTVVVLLSQTHMQWCARQGRRHLPFPLSYFTLMLPSSETFLGLSSAKVRKPGRYPTKRVDFQALMNNSE